MSCTDWEMAQSYRSWRDEYEEEWETKFRMKYERQMIDILDTYFYVGTVHRYPKECDYRWPVLPAEARHTRPIRLKRPPTEATYAFNGIGVHIRAPDPFECLFALALTFGFGWLLRPS